MGQTIDVSYVAELARLALTPEETKSLQSQLESIVKYVEKISELDVSAIEPTLHGQALVNQMRADVVSPSMDRETAIGLAPARHDYEVKLPKIVEDAES